MTTWARYFKFAGAIVQRLQLVMVALTHFSAHYAWFSRGQSHIWPDLIKGGTLHINNISLFKLGTNILHHANILATNSEPRPLPIWAGQASASFMFGKCHFMPLYGSSPLRIGGSLRFLTLNLWSRRPKVQKKKTDRALTGLKWWQKINISCAKCPLSSNLVT